MYITFIGDHRSNGGPNNVNKQIIRYKSRNILYVNFSNRFAKYPDALIKILISKVVIVSGLYGINIFALKIAKLLGKKTIYIMHGCAEHEAMINGRKLSRHNIRVERATLQYSDLLLPVSKKFCQWVKNQYPQYADKTQYWHFGIEQIQMDSNNTIRESNTIAAAGGDMPRKRNEILSNVVEKMNGRVNLTVYGNLNLPELSRQYKHTTWAGLVDNNIFLQELQGKSVFVVNSVFDTLNITGLEALLCGCSVLISSQAGVLELMNLSEQDIIVNPDDEEEIEQKLMYLLDHPNNKRIREAMDWELLDPRNAVKRLVDICTALAE